MDEEDKSLRQNSFLSEPLYLLGLCLARRHVKGRCACEDFIRTGQAIDNMIFWSHLQQ